MLVVLVIAGILCLIQGIAPLVQKAAGQDPRKSYFIVNHFPHDQPLVNIGLIVLGVLLLVVARGIRKARR
jgi:hypothetical protein